MEGISATCAMQLDNRYVFKASEPNKPMENITSVSAAGPLRARKLNTSLQSVSRSTRKSTVTKTDKKAKDEDVHPLALAFKGDTVSLHSADISSRGVSEKSEEYRRHLYSTAAAKINNDLDILLDRLYKSNVQVTSSDPAKEGSQGSSLRLTMPARYERTVQKLYHPLSGYRYNLQKTSSSGEIEYIQTNLHDRFRDFEKHMQVETEQIKELQRQWEGVVAEIFQLGVACLGETDTAALLSTADADLNAASPASKVEPTLLVPKRGSTAKVQGKRKHDLSASLDMWNLFPEFLFNTRENQKPVPTAPELPLDDVWQFEKEISVLGKQHSADLQRLEHEHKAWWERKQKQLAHTFMQD